MQIPLKPYIKNALRFTGVSFTGPVKVLIIRIGLFSATSLAHFVSAGGSNNA